MYENTDVVQLLLNNSDAVIELNIRDNSGWTANDLAFYTGAEDIVKLLRRHLHITYQK